MIKHPPVKPLRTLLIFLAVLRCGLAVAADVSTSGESPIPFPPGFWWGTSLSAHQVEGGNSNTWTEWEAVPGHIRNNETSGAAADEWNRYEEDFDLLVRMHANTHRMSIEWSRLEPRPGVWDEGAAAHYRQMILALKKRGIRPVVCLFHFTLPIWVGKAGAFENPEMLDAFVRFAEKSAETFGDVVTDWLTMNEPNVYALAAYGGAGTPPGVKDYGRAARVLANLMKAHGRAYRAIKKVRPASTISFAHHMRVFAPYRRYSPFDHLGAYYADEFFNWSFLRAIQTGDIDLSVPAMVSLHDRCEECVGALDYLGVNYYTRDLVSVSLFSPDKLRMITRDGAPLNDLGWEIYPEGFADILRALAARGFAKYPVLITENGVADARDRFRADFIYRELKTFLTVSREVGLTPMGYLHWALVDNFEWLEGRSPRFGLVAIDYATQKRSLRASGEYFGELGRERRLIPPPASTAAAESVPAEASRPGH